MSLPPEHPSGSFNLPLSTETPKQVQGMCLPGDGSPKSVRSSEGIGVTISPVQGGKQGRSLVVTR